MIIPVVTTDTLEGYRTAGAGMLLSTTVAVNWKDYNNGISDSIIIENAKEAAVEALRAKAAEIGFNAIVGLRFDLFKAKDGLAFSLVSAYATGVKVVEKVI